MTERQLSRIKTVPGSLEGVLDALEKDHKFLLEGDVFSKELIDTCLLYTSPSPRDRG